MLWKYTNEKGACKLQILIVKTEPPGQAETMEKKNIIPTHLILTLALEADLNKDHDTFIRF